MTSGAVPTTQNSPIGKNFNRTCVCNHFVLLLTAFCDHHHTIRTSSNT
jgi:hypothetical protein